MANGNEKEEGLKASNVYYSADEVQEKREKTAREMDKQFKDIETPAIVREIRNKLESSERSRYYREDQWLRNTNSYRGEDSWDNVFRESEQSKVYVRTTTVKVKAAYSQIVEALFSDNKFPISVRETRVPEGVSKWAHLDTGLNEELPNEQNQPDEEPAGPLGGIGFAGDGFDPAPGATADNMHFLGGLKETFTDKEGDVVLNEGLSHAPNAVNVSPAKIAARNMEKVIHDHLEESNAQIHMRRAIFDMCLLGTGVMKGPFNVDKEIPRYVMNEETGERDYEPMYRKSFQCSHVSVWNFYPDPTALNPEDMEWVVERHRMNAQQVYDLRSRPHFNINAIERLLHGGGNYYYRRYETSLEEDNIPERLNDLFEVLEYWGYVSKDMAEQYGLDVTGIKGDRVQVNAWVSGNEVLRVVINPFLPQRIPYYVVPYEVDSYTLWGTGVPESMEDSQALMNGFMRLAVDNLALAGNLVFDIDDTMLEPGQSDEIYPGRIFRRRGGGPGQAVHGISFPNTAPANMDMFRQVRQIADEETGIPSFAHGQTGVTSPTRTASGMSMLLQNASLNIKTVIRNIDDRMLVPLGKNYYRSVMQFSTREDVRGDMEIRATGSSSLQAKEVRANRLNTFLQLAANPALAPLIKFPTVLKELAITMEMDPDEIMNSPEEQQIYAQLMRMQNMQQAAPAPGGPAGVPTSQVPMPTEGSFSGNTEGAGNPAGLNGAPEGF